MKKRKMRVNSDKAFNNFGIFMSGITIGILIVKIATNGIAWISTTGLLG